jgi:hypothetical protein
MQRFIIFVVVVDGSDVKPYLVGLPIADNESQVRHCMGAELLRWDGQPPGDEQRGANGAERGNLADHDPKVMYSGDQLDTLAILFVIVKILYLGGALQRSKSLAVLVESAVLTSIVPLHRTLVRNEAAYFGCIHQVSPKQPSTLGSLQGSSKDCPKLCSKLTFQSSNRRYICQIPINKMKQFLYIPRL